MKMSKILMVGAVAALTATSSFAVTQGLKGQTSTGTSDITLEIKEEVQITGMADVDLGQYVPSGGDIAVSQTVCIYYNNSTDYEIQFDSLTDATESNGFELILAGNKVPYTVGFSDGSDGTYDTMTEGATAPYTNASPSDTCGGSTNADFLITVADTGSLGLPDGDYTDTLSITITPDP